MPRQASFSALCAVFRCGIGSRMTKLAMVLMVVAACAGDDGVDLDSYDPRCVTACTDAPPPLDGAGDVCDTASRKTCLDSCAVRIAGVTTVCASCLLEDACFDPNGCDDVISPGDQCTNNTCTRTGRAGSCSYPANDSAARDNCERQVNPRREVACTVEFAPVSTCASSCQM